MYTYTLTQWLFIFYTYCFFGWCFETVVVSVEQRHFVNRGFLRGPVLPLYGTGAVLILMIALPVRGNIPLLFLLGMIFPTILEYCTGWAMETLFKMKYWDYSTHRFNFQGRICLLSTVAWGFLSVALIKFFHPPVERLTLRFANVPLAVFVCVVSVLFIADASYAVITTLDLNRFLEELTHLRAELDNVRLQLALARESAPRLEELQKRFSDLRREYEEKLYKSGFFKGMLIKAHPRARSKVFNDALTELKTRLREKRSK